MTKEDPVVSMNSKNEYSSTKGSNEKNFTEKLGSKLKKTIKNSSNKIKKGLDKTTSALDSDSDHKGSKMDHHHDSSSFNHAHAHEHHHQHHNHDYDHQNLSEESSESYDNNNSNDPYFKDHNTSSRYKFNATSYIDRNGNKITKKGEEKKGNYLDTKNNNHGLYDEFHHYTTTRDSDYLDPQQAVPNYSDIVIEGTKTTSDNSGKKEDSDDGITEKMKSLNMSSKNDDKGSTYHQISKTLQSRENELPVKEDELPQIKKEDDSFTQMSPVENDHPESNSETGN